jgi:subtilase family serine protease
MPTSLALTIILSLYKADPYSDPGYNSYTGPKQCGGYAPAKVISTSYAGNEVGFTRAYAIRQCNEYAKLGLMGTTFLYSSGDQGVANYNNKCVNTATNTYNNGKSGMFVPTFPSGCPYVLSVGATRIPAGGSVTSPEIASNTVIYLSGFGLAKLLCQLPPSLHFCPVQQLTDVSCLSRRECKRRLLRRHHWRPTI